ncbi:MAG TPA: aminotransferase class III-fold pyridoxal phosphate-dependent enzyme, partial [Pseudomonadota bacterium]|nr:aminotransferase class III-fold pyridoxal phosphate-dependent enzyme [Pseudomonadota bacterium]
VLSSADAMDVFRPGSHGSTFGGNPLACAVARAAIRVLDDEKLCQRAATLGAPLLSRLRQIKSPYIREIRGRGLLVGIELDRPARPFCEALAERGVLCKETHDFVLRIAPPLVVSAEDLDWAVDQFAAVLG